MTSIQQTSPGQFALQGPLDLSTVTLLRREGQRQFAAAEGQLTLDLATVTRADSAGLALLVDWLAWAGQHQRRLSFRNLPPVLQALARICDVEPLLNPS
jgi:phospholipid transport system transporter-binding protein